MQRDAEVVERVRVAGLEPQSLVAAVDSGGKRPVLGMDASEHDKVASLGFLRQSRRAGPDTRQCAPVMADSWYLICACRVVIIRLCGGYVAADVDAQRFDQGGDMTLVLAPAFDGFAVNRSSYLIVAGCCNGALGFVELQTGIIPFESAELNHSAAQGFLIIDQIFVLHLQHRDGERLAPMRHQAQILPIVHAKFGQVVGVGMMRVEVLEIDGDAGVDRIAHAMDDLRAGKHQLDQTKILKIVRHLVRDPDGGGVQACQPVQMLLRERIQRLAIDHVYAIEEG